MSPYKVNEKPKCATCRGSGMVHPLKDGRTDYGTVVRCFDCREEGGRQIGSSVSDYQPDLGGTISREEALVEMMAAMMPRPCCHDEAKEAITAGGMEQIAAVIGDSVRRVVDQARSERPAYQPKFNQKVGFKSDVL